MKSLLALLLCIPVLSIGQKVYVECDDPKPRGSIEKKVTELNYLIAEDSAKADIVAKFVHKQLKNPVVSFKVKPNIAAKILFYDSKGMLLVSTEEVGGLAGVWAGYNPRIDAAWKILTRDFETKLRFAADKVKDATSKAADRGRDVAGSKAHEIGKLKKLLDDGALTKEEFEAEKKKILEK